MDTAIISGKVFEIIHKTFRVEKDKISMQTRFVEDLRADSLDLAAAGMEIEDEFDIAISEDIAEKIKTVDDLVAMLQSRLSTNDRRQQR